MKRKIHPFFRPALILLSLFAFLLFSQSSLSQAQNPTWSPVSKFPGLSDRSLASSWNPITGELFVVANAENGTLWFGTFNAMGEFEDWTNIPGMAGAPVALTLKPVPVDKEEFHLVVRAADGSLWHGTFTRLGDFKNDWKCIAPPGTTAVAPSMAWNPATEELVLMVTSPDQTLGFRRYGSKSDAKFKVSGYVRNAAGAMNKVGIEVYLNNSFNISAETNSNGYYELMLRAGFSYVLKPVLKGSNFNPAQATVTVDADKQQDFDEATTPSGKWATQVAAATKLDKFWDWQRDASAYGFEGESINQSQKKYYLADPKSFGIPFHGSGWSKSDVTDATPGGPQGAIINIYYPKVIKIDADAKELDWWYMTGGGDFSTRDIRFSQIEYNSGVRLLIEIEEKGQGSSNKGLTILWKFN